MADTWTTEVTQESWTSDNSGITFLVRVGGTGEGGGVTVHAALSGRDAADQHPMSAIEGLVEYFSGPLDLALTTGVDNRIANAFSAPASVDGDIAAAVVSVDATGFGTNLSGTDTDVQTALETLDALVAGGGTHEDGGADELALDASQITSGVLDIGRVASGTPTGSLFVRDDSVLATPAGGGDVSGPGSSTDGHLAVFSGTSGTVLADGGQIPVQWAMGLWDIPVDAGTDFGPPFPAGTPIILNNQTSGAEDGLYEANGSGGVSGSPTPLKTFGNLGLVIVASSTFTDETQLVLPGVDVDLDGYDPEVMTEFASVRIVTSPDGMSFELRPTMMTPQAIARSIGKIFTPAGGDFTITGADDSHQLSMQHWFTRVDTTGGDAELVMPMHGGVPRDCYIYNTGPGEVTVVNHPAETAFSYTLSPGEFVSIRPDGVAWRHWPQLHPPASGDAGKPLVVNAAEGSYDIGEWPTSGSGDVVGPASAVNNGVVLFDSTTGKLVKDGGALGDAAAKDTGTGAGTVAAGDDSRLSDARTPTAHAASHGSAGGDPVTVAESQVTGLTSALAGKAAASHNHAASEVNSGTLDDARIPSLAASKVTSGVFAIARLATGTPTGFLFVRDDGTLVAPSANGPVSTSQTGTTYQLVAADDGLTIRCTNAALVTVTLPTNATAALRLGFRVTLFASGAGGVTLSTTGLTLSGSSPKKTVAQNQGIYVEKWATDSWVIIGGTAT